MKYNIIIITLHSVPNKFMMVTGFLLNQRLAIGKLNENVAPLPSLLFSAHILPP